MTYCLGIMTHQGLVMASDSRTNAGSTGKRVPQDAPVRPRRRARLRHPRQRRPVDHPIRHHAAPPRLRPGRGLATARPSTTPPASSASRSAGSPTWTARRWSATRYSFNVNLLLGGQIARRGAPTSTSSTRRATPSRRPRIRPTSRSARASTAGPSSTAACDSGSRRWTRRSSPP